MFRACWHRLGKRHLQRKGRCSCWGDEAGGRRLGGEAIYTSPPPKTSLCLWMSSSERIKKEKGKRRITHNKIVDRGNKETGMKLLPVVLCHLLSWCMWRKGGRVRVSLQRVSVARVSAASRVWGLEWEGVWGALDCRQSVTSTLGESEWVWRALCGLPVRFLCLG